MVVIGSGFGGLFAAQALKRADVDVTLISKTTTHLFQPLLYQVATGILSEGEIAPATAGDPRGPAATRRCCWGRSTDLDLQARTVTHMASTGPLVTPYDSLIVAAGAGPVLLRQRPLRPSRAGHEDHRRRAGAARADLRRVRAGRAGDRPGEDRAAPDVRGGRRGPDRRRDGRADRRALPPGPAQGLPPDRHHEGPDRPAGRGAGGARLRSVPKLSADGRQHPARTSASRCTWTPRWSDVDAPASTYETTPTAPHVHPVRLQGVGGGGVRLARWASAGRARRHRGRPRRSGAGQSRPHAARSPGGLRRRRPDGPEQPPGRRAGGDPGWPARCQDDPRADRRKAGTRRRSTTRTRAAWPRSPGSARWRGSASFETAGFIAWVLWLVVHLMYIVGFKNRLTTLLHWAVSFIGRGRSSARSPCSRC